MERGNEVEGPGKKKGGGIMKSSSRGAANGGGGGSSGGGCGNSSQVGDAGSVSSISTQTSVYAPTFNPTTRVSSDWYDSMNDSDTSTSLQPLPHRGLRLNLRDHKPMARILEQQPTNLDDTFPSSSLTRSTTTNDHLVPPSVGTLDNKDSSSFQSYFSDVPSSISSTSFVQRGSRHLTTRSRSSPTLTSLEQAPHPKYNASNPTLPNMKPSYHKSALVNVSLPFKERNFNFNFENNSFTSVNGMHECENLYGNPSSKVMDVEAPHASKHMLYAMKQPPHMDSLTMDEGYNSEYRLGLRRLSSIRSVDFKDAEESFEDDNNSASLYSKEPSEQTNTYSNDDMSIGSVGGQVASNVKMGPKGVFLLCIPRGICMTEGTMKRIGLASRMDLASHNLVKECVKKLWADTYHPKSFDSCICHIHQAQLLRQLISHGNCPNILLHGPCQFGKKRLIMALLHELFGPDAWKVSWENKQYNKIGEKEGSNIELLTSNFHCELESENLKGNARNALVSLFKEIAQAMEHTRVVVPGREYEHDFKVIVIHSVDNLPNDTQQLLRWLMDRYGDTCKLLLCCINANNLLEPVQSRCQKIGVDMPSHQEMVAVLQHIAREEHMMVSQNFLSRIANESKQNLRHAIESLEARKPPSPGQAVQEDIPIPNGWEDTVIDIATHIRVDQSPKGLFVARDKLQSILRKHVPARLILQTLALELSKKLAPELRGEICYWHAICEKRLKTSGSAINKLEDFVAKFMSIYKKHKKERPPDCEEFMSQDSM